MPDQNQIPSREREPLAFARLVLKALAAPGLTRTPEMVGGLAAEGSLAALVAIAESLESIDKTLESIDKALGGTARREASRRVVERMGPATDSRDAEVLPR